MCLESSGSPDESESVRVDIVLCNFPRFCRWSGWVGDEHERLGEHPGLAIHRFARRCGWVPSGPAAMCHST